MNHKKRTDSLRRDRKASNIHQLTPKKPREKTNSEGNLRSFRPKRIERTQDPIPRADRETRSRSRVSKAAKGEKPEPDFLEEENGGHERSLNFISLPGRIPPY